MVKAMKQRWRASTLGRSASVLSSADKNKIIIISLVQIFLSFLDLLGVLAVGLLGAVAVSGVASSKPENRVNEVLKFLQISEISFQLQTSILGAIAIILLIGRTFFSIFFTRRILFFLSRRGASISANLVSRMLSQPLMLIQTRSTQEIIFSVTRGVEYLVLNVIATGVVLFADISLLVVMGIGLFIVDPITAISIILLFSVIGFSLYRLLHVRAGELGLKSSKLTIESNEKVVEVFGSYRESIVRNRRDYYSREIGKQRYHLAETMAEIYFMPFIGKYLIETSVVLGALLVGSVQFVLQDTSQAVATLAIFLAAGTRIAPSVLRVQQGWLQIRGGLGSAGPTLTLIEVLGNAEMIKNIDDTVDVVHDGFKARIEVKNVSFSYPDKRHPTIKDLTLFIPIGAFIAIVGPSGAGKTTMVDIVLGVLTPDEGQVFVSGLPPLSAVAKWPGAVAYVPQDVTIANGSIRENVALGYPSEAATDDLVVSALKIACLDEFVTELPDGIDTQVGEKGLKMSGGQRQRLGIARALFTKPHLLVLDEATSSLDGETETSISTAIQALRGSTTVVTIAHRLSTVRHADMVVYLQRGNIVATGTFEEVRNLVPDFDRQAKLMGL
jgi:ABC-type multidrug transport system fused ATPase/permease subunit